MGRAGLRAGYPAVLAPDPAHRSDGAPYRQPIDQGNRAAAARAGVVRRLLPDGSGARALLHVLLDLSGRARLREERGRLAVGAWRDLRDRRVLPDAVAGAALRFYPHPDRQPRPGRAALHADRLGGGFPVAAASRPGAAFPHLPLISRP